MMKQLTLWVAALALSALAQADLLPRLNGAAAYDDVLDITWLTDASLSGSQSWSDQLSWIDTLNSQNHLGFDDWRLASMSVASGVPTGLAESVVDCATIWEPLCRDSELGHMFYHTLGGDFGADVSGTRTVGDVTLFNVQPLYWSGTESGTTNAWMLHFDSGFGVWSPKNGSRFAWAVRAGDVLAIDSDGDGVADASDNCLLVSNPDQRDSNNDGFGNLCDADLDNNGIVNFVDLGIFAAVFGGVEPDADINGDGSINFLDFAVVVQQFGQPPGPSGIAP